MDHATDLTAIADAAMAAHVEIDKHGTPEMKALSRRLLFSIGREIARRSMMPEEPPGFPQTGFDTLQDRSH